MSRHFRCFLEPRSMFTTQEWTKRTKWGFEDGGVEMPANTVFVEHGHLQHAAACWNEVHMLQDHIFIIPNGGNLKDGMALVYGALLGCSSKLCWMHEVEVYGNDSDALKPDGTNCSRPIKMGILHSLLERC